MTRVKLIPYTWLALLLFCSTSTALPCSMYKLTVHGKTMLGNNEDSWRLTSHIWFEQGTPNTAGAVYVGYAEKPHPDGGMNEYGLAFDAFTMPHRPLMPATDPHKPDFAYSQLKTILQTCKTVDDAYVFLNARNLHILNGSPLFNGGMLLFVDKTGKYLAVEADKLTLGNDSTFLLANFSPTGPDDRSSVKMERYQKGVRFLDRHPADTSIAFCTALSDTMCVHRPKAGDGTLYTTIYDLNEGMVYAYFFHDFSKRKTFNLQAELQKGNHSYAFADLFPENEGYQKFVRYRTPQNSTALFVFLVFAVVLFLASFVYFLVGGIKGMVRAHANPLRTRNTKLGLSVIYLCMGYYCLVLLNRQAIFYFPAPYSEKGHSLLNLMAYWPSLALVLLIPVAVLSVKAGISKAWNLFSKILFTTNTLAYVLLVALFAYWQLFDVFHAS